MEKSQNQHTYICLAFIPIFDHQKELFGILKNSINARELIASGKGDCQKNETKFLAFTALFRLFEILLVIYIPGGLIWLLVLNGNHFMLLNFNLKLFPIGSIHSFQILPDDVILSACDVSLDIVIGMQKQDNSMH